jgi:hypothetical protein
LGEGADRGVANEIHDGAMGHSREHGERRRRVEVVQTARTRGESARAAVERAGGRAAAFAQLTDATGRRRKLPKDAAARTVEDDDPVERGGIQGLGAAVDLERSGAERWEGALRTALEPLRGDAAVGAPELRQPAGAQAAPTPRKGSARSGSGQGRQAVRRRGRAGSVGQAARWAGRSRIPRGHGAGEERR